MDYFQHNEKNHRPKETNTANVSGTFDLVEFPEIIVQEGDEISETARNQMEAFMRRFETEDEELIRQVENLKND